MNEDHIRRLVANSTKNNFLKSNIAWYEYKRTVETACSQMKKDAYVLDIGCGSGYSTAYMSCLRPDIKVVGVEPIAQNIWKKLETNNVKYIKGDGMNLPFKPRTFDVAVSFGVMEHVPNDKVFLQEINRVLKIGGKNLIFHLPNKFSINDLLAKVFGHRGHEIRYTKNRAKKLVEKNGFRVISIEEEYFLPLQIYRVSKNMGAIFDKNYRKFSKLDSLLVKTPLNFFSQSYRIFSIKK